MLVEKFRISGDRIRKPGLRENPTVIFLTFLIKPLLLKYFPSMYFKACV